MIDLTKGVKMDLTKGSALKKVKFGLGWDVKAAQANADFDLDAIAAALNADGKVTETPGFVYFKNLTNGSITHSGDNLTGAGAGEDEVITVDLDLVPADKVAIEISICIFQAAARNQNFGQVNNAFVKVYDADTNTELAKYDLSEDYSAFKSVKVGKLYRHDGEWKFQALGEGLAGEITELAVSYGL